jgi:hypothetical protein
LQANDLEGPKMDLFDLAKNPVEFDTELAGLRGRLDVYKTRVTSKRDAMHKLAGDRKSYRNTRVPVWGKGWVEVHENAQHLAAHGDVNATALVRELAQAEAMADAINGEIERMDTIYRRRPWSRFVVCVSSTTPHVHRSTGCSTLNRGEFMSDLRWHPELSGMDSATAVETLDESLCSVCYPDAPVALREGYVSKRSQAEAAARAAEKDARNDAKSLKNLTEAETKQLAELPGIGRFDAPKTVAAAKAMIRQPAETKAELDWYESGAAAKAMFAANSGWIDSNTVSETVTRRTASCRANLVNETAAAELAITILAEREAARPGSGQTREDSARAQANAAKRALKNF